MDTRTREQVILDQLRRQSQRAIEAVSQFPEVQELGRQMAEVYLDMERTTDVVTADTFIREAQQRGILDANGLPVAFHKP